MVKTRSQMKSVKKKKLKVEDVLCAVCLDIFLRPVTMLCGHTICLECFQNTVTFTSYNCPLCRGRVSSWLRTFKQDWNSLVDENLWRAVQEQYPVEVQRKLNDEDDGIAERI